MPFWVDTRVEAFICIVEIDFGREASSQMRSSKREAVFCPASRFVSGSER